MEKITLKRFFDYLIYRIKIVLKAIDKSTLNKNEG